MFTRRSRARNPEERIRLLEAQVQELHRTLRQVLPYIGLNQDGVFQRIITAGSATSATGTSIHGTAASNIPSGGSGTMNKANGGQQTGVKLYLPGTITTNQKGHAVRDEDGSYYWVAEAC